MFVLWVVWGCCVKLVNVWLEIWKHTCQRHCDLAHMELTRCYQQRRQQMGCGTMRRPEFSAVASMEKQTNQSITSTYFNLTTATTYGVSTLFLCVYILLHHVANTVNNRRTSRVYLLNLICIAVISFFLWPVFNRVTLQDYWLLTALRHSLVACYSIIVRILSIKRLKHFFFLLPGSCKSSGKWNLTAG